MQRKTLGRLGGFLAATLSAALAFLPVAHAQDVAPDALVKTVTLEIVDIIAKDKDIKAGDRRKVIDLIETKVLPHFNFTSMTRLAVATNWEKANADQKKRLSDEF